MIFMPWSVLGGLALAVPAVLSSYSLSWGWKRWSRWSTKETRRKMGANHGLPPSLLTFYDKS